MSEVRATRSDSIASLTLSKLSCDDQMEIVSCDIPFVEHVDVAAPICEVSSTSAFPNEIEQVHKPQFISTLTYQDEEDENFPTAQAEELIHPRMRSLSNASCQSMTHVAQVCVRPEFIAVAALKKTPSTKLGLCFTTNERGTFISRITENSPFRPHFQPGDRIVSVNTINCLLVGRDDIAELIRSIPNSVTIVVHNKGGDPLTVSNTVHKPPNTKALISLRTRRGALTISKVAMDSPFCNTLLVSHHRAMCINGITCQGMPPREAAAILHREDVITIISRPHADIATVIACGIHKKWWTQVATAAGIAATAVALSSSMPHAS